MRLYSGHPDRFLQEDAGNFYSPVHHMTFPVIILTYKETVITLWREETSQGSSSPRELWWQPPRHCCLSYCPSASELRTCQLLSRLFVVCEASYWHLRKAEGGKVAKPTCLIQNMAHWPYMSLQWCLWPQEPNRHFKSRKGCTLTKPIRKNVVSFLKLRI